MNNNIIKKDLPIIREFLNTETPQTALASSLKTVRTYANGNGYNDIIVIVTPTAAENADQLIDDILKLLENHISGNITYQKHQRGKNIVYQFKKTE